MQTAPIALLSQTEHLSAARSEAIIKHAMAAIAIVGVMALAQPVWGQMLSGPGGAGGGGGGLTGGIFLTGNTYNSSSGAPAGNSLTISGTGGASVGMSGSVLLISGAAAGAATASLTALGNTTGLTSSETQNLAGWAMSGAGNLSIGFSNGTWILSDTTAASASAANLFALGNTTGATSSTTATLTQLTFSAAGGASLGYSTTAAGAGVVIVSAPTTVASATSGGQTAIGNTTGATTSETAPITAFNISGAGGDSVGFSNGTLIVSGATTAASATSGGLLAVGNTTGLTSSTTNVLTNLSVSGAGGISVGYSTTGAGAPQLVISAATAGGALISNLQGPVVPGLSAALIGAAAGSFTQELLLPIVVPASLVLNQARVLAQFGLMAGGGFGSSAGSKTGTGGLSETFSIAVYAETAPGAFATTGVLTSPISVSVSLSQTGSSWSETQSVTYPSGSGTASSTFSTAVGTANYVESQVLTKWINYNNQVRLDIGASAQSTLTPGNYMLGIYSSGSTAGSSLFTSGGGGIKIGAEIYAGLVATGGGNLTLTENVIGGTRNEPIWFIGTIASSNSSSFSVSQVSDFSASSYGGFYVTLGAS